MNGLGIISSATHAINGVAMLEQTPIGGTRSLLLAVLIISPVATDCGSDLDLVEIQNDLAAVSFFDGFEAFFKVFVGIAVGDDGFDVDAGFE